MASLQHGYHNWAEQVRVCGPPGQELEFLWLWLQSLAHTPAYLSSTALLPSSQLNRMRQNHIKQGCICTAMHAHVLQGVLSRHFCTWICGTLVKKSGHHFLTQCGWSLERSPAPSALWLIPVPSDGTSVKTRFTNQHLSSPQINMHMQGWMNHQVKYFAMYLIPFLLPIFFFCCLSLTLFNV